MQLRDVNSHQCTSAQPQTQSLWSAVQCSERGSSSQSVETLRRRPAERVFHRTLCCRVSYMVIVHWKPDFLLQLIMSRGASRVHRCNRQGKCLFPIIRSRLLHLPDLSQHGDICKAAGHRWQVDTQMPRLDTAARPALSHSWMYTASPQPGLNYNPLLLGQELAPAKPEAKRSRWLFNCNGI